MTNNIGLVLGNKYINSMEYFLQFCKVSVLEMLFEYYYYWKLFKNKCII